MTAILEIILYVVVACFFLFLIYEAIPKRCKCRTIYTKDNNKNYLYNASVTDNGTPANMVFKALEKDNIKPNYLGHQKKE